MLEVFVGGGEGGVGGIGEFSGMIFGIVGVEGGGFVVTGEERDMRSWRAIGEGSHDVSKNSYEGAWLGEKEANGKDDSSKMT